MSHLAKQLGDALTWIERNHPGGVALVARALAETTNPTTDALAGVRTFPGLKDTPEIRELIGAAASMLRAPETTGIPRNVRVVRCGDGEACYDAEVWEGDVLLASVRVADDAEQIAAFLRRTPPVQYPSLDTDTK